MGQCFYSFEVLVTEDTFGNKADPGWAWLLEQAITAVKLYLQSTRVAQRQAAGSASDVEQPQRKRARRVKQKQTVSTLASDAAVLPESQVRGQMYCCSPKFCCDTRSCAYSNQHALQSQSACSVTACLLTDVCWLWYIGWCKYSSIVRRSVENGHRQPISGLTWWPWSESILFQSTHTAVVAACCKADGPSVWTGLELSK